MMYPVTNDVLYVMIISTWLIHYKAHSSPYMIKTNCWSTHSRTNSYKDIAAINIKTANTVRLSTMPYRIHATHTSE